MTRRGANLTLLTKEKDLMNLHLFHGKNVELWKASWPVDRMQTEIVSTIAQTVGEHLVSNAHVHEQNQYKQTWSSIGSTFLPNYLS